MSVLHDWECATPDCGQRAFDYFTDAPPSCSVHGASMEVTYLPKHYRPFEPFSYEEDGSGRQVQVTSITQLRDIESSSMKAYERGEGRPVVFRQYTQDQSNRDANVFQDRHPQARREKLVTRSRSGIPFITSRTGPPIEAPEE